MSILVIAEHDNNNLKGATLNTVTAATSLNGSLGLTKIKELKLRVVLLNEGETLKLKKELFSFLLIAK